MACGLHHLAIYLTSKNIMLITGSCDSIALVRLPDEGDEAGCLAAVEPGLSAHHLLKRLTVEYTKASTGSTGKAAVVLAEAKV